MVFSENKRGIEYMECTKLWLLPFYLMNLKIMLTSFTCGDPGIDLLALKKQGNVNKYKIMCFCRSVRHFESVRAILPVGTHR